MTARLRRAAFPLPLAAQAAATASERAAEASGRREPRAEQGARHRGSKPKLERERRSHYFKGAPQGGRGAPTLFVRYAVCLQYT